LVSQNDDTEGVAEESTLNAADCRARLYHKKSCRRQVNLVDQHLYLFFLAGGKSDNLAHHGFLPSHRFQLQQFTLQLCRRLPAVGPPAPRTYPNTHCSVSRSRI
jgi:hypothetical protein